MPRPKTPWIAIDFDERAIQVALLPDDAKEPIALSYPNLFIYDESARKPELSPVVEGLTEEEARNVFTFVYANIKSNANVGVPNGDESFPVDRLLKLQLAWIKSECERRYFPGKKIETCYIVHRSRKHVGKTLESAARAAGFANVEHRDKASIILGEARKRRVFENRVVLCDIAQGYVSLTLLERCGNGYVPNKSSKAEGRVYTGFEYVPHKLAKSTLKSLEKAGKDVEPLKKGAVAFEFAVAEALAKAEKNAEKIDVRFLKQPYVITRAAIDKRSQQLVDSLEPFFKSYFNGTDRLLRDARFEIAIVGAGANATGLKRKLLDIASNSTGATPLENGDAALAWARVLLDFEELPDDPTDEERAYAKDYRKAVVGGSPEEKMNLALRYANGKGTICCYEESFYWLNEAAKGDLGDAQYLLGKCYESGLGVAPDKEKARNAYLEAARNGVAKAQRKMFLFYQEEGRQDLARHYLEAAVKQGEPESIRQYKRLGYDKEVSIEDLGAPVKKPKKPSESRDQMIGVFLAALVFLVGAGFFDVDPNLGAIHKDFAEISRFICYISSLILVIVACFFAVQWIFRGDSKPKGVS